MSEGLTSAFDDIDEPDEEEIDPFDDYCPCGSNDLFSECCHIRLGSDEVEEAIVDTLKWHPLTRDFSLYQLERLAEEIAETAWPFGRPVQHGDPDSEGDIPTRAELYAVADRFKPECRYCADTGDFYGDPELGPCGCTPEEIDIAALIG